MKHYMKSDGNGGVNMSWKVLGILCTIIALTSATVVYGVTTRNKIDSLEEHFEDIEVSFDDLDVREISLRTDFEKLCVKIDNMAEDIKEIKEYIKGE